MAAIEATKGSNIRPLDLYYKLLKFGWKRKSFQKDRQGYSWTAKERIQVGEYHLGSLWKTFPILLKLFPKATKLGSLFPKVKTNLSTQTAGRFQVRAENTDHLTCKHMCLHANMVRISGLRETPLEGAQTA